LVGDKLASGTGSCIIGGYIVLRFAVILSTPMWLALGGWYVFVAVLLYVISGTLDRRFFSAARLQPVVEPVDVPVSR
jgi:hypothetical protein